MSLDTYEDLVRDIERIESMSDEETLTYFLNELFPEVILGSDGEEYYLNLSWSEIEKLGPKRNKNCVISFIETSKKVGDTGGEYEHFNKAFTYYHTHHSSVDF
jgi:hypothetical protein